MQIHGRAKLGPAGRLALGEAIEGGGCGEVALCATASSWVSHKDAMGARVAAAIDERVSRGRVIPPGLLRPPPRPSGACGA
jgi:hypothetical protein